MATLCQALELMHGAPERFTVVRAVVREWRHPVLAQIASERHAAGRAGVAGAGRGDVARPRADEAAVTRLWWAKPDRIRLQREELGGAPAGWLEVAVGELWWGYHREWGAVSNEGDPEMRSGSRDAPFPELFEPALHLPALRLEVTGETTHAARAALLVRGLPRPVSETVLTPLLPPGADFHGLVVDGETGVVLRRSSFIEEAPFSMIEVQEIAFDEAPDEDVFTFRAPAGVEIRPADEVFRSPPTGPGGMPAFGGM
jgi:outer membrane lipoprotein-sorting protein